MSAVQLQTVELQTGEPVNGSVVWLHGLGADGHDFEPIVPELVLDDTNLRFVFPHAPVQPVTLNNGFPSRSWFDILGLDRQAQQDEPGIRQAEGWVRELIGREIERGVPANKIVVAGFSQGGALALHTGLRYTERLAGVCGLSTYIPLQPKLDSEAHPSNRDTSVFLGHGVLDPLVGVKLGEGTRDLLAEHGYAVEWNSYPMAHAVCQEEIHDIRTWLGRCFV